MFLAFLLFFRFVRVSMKEVSSVLVGGEAVFVVVIAVLVGLFVALGSVLTRKKTKKKSKETHGLSPFVKKRQP